MGKRFLPLLLAVSATASQWEFKDIRGPTGASGPRRYDVYGAVAVGRQNLAVLLVRTADEKEKKRLEAEHGMTSYFVLAWLSSTWAVKELGARFFTWPNDMVPQASDFSRVEERFAPRLFPKVLVRAEEVVATEEGEEETCPYLLAFPTKICCFNGELKVTATHDMPFVMNNVRVVDGEVWVVGVWEDHLIHRYDLEQRKLVEHRLPLSRLRQAMERAGVKGEEMASVVSPGKELRKVRILPLEQEATTPEQQVLQKYLRSFTLPLYTLPTSFQYDVALHTSRAGVLVRKPLGLWVTGWPEGGKDHFLRVESKDLPALPGGPTRLYLLGLEAVGNDDFFAAFEVHVPQTFAQWLVENPSEAREYEKAHGGQVAPRELVGGVMALMGLRFSRDKVEESWFQPWSTMEKWRPDRTPLFAYRPGEAWLGLWNKKNGFLWGIGRLQ
jgi:hypothetical protein